MKLSRETANISIAAVEAALAEGAAPYGAPPMKGCFAAIAVAAQRLGMPAMTLRSRVEPGGSCERLFGLKVDWSIAASAPRANPAKIAAARGELGFAPVLPGYEISSTAVQRDADGNIQKEWIKQAREHGDVFQMPDGHVIKGVSALLDGNGRTIAQWVKTREDDGVVDMVEALKAVFEGYQGLARPAPAPVFVDADILTVYPVADLHVGLYSWAPETGDDYDLAIVERIFLEKMGILVAKASPSKMAILLNLGDFFHSDTRNNRTEQSGAVLDVDSRYARVLQIGVRLLISAIDLALQKHEEVIVRNLPGNHDYHSALALTIALGAFYHNEPRVKVDHDPSKFFVTRFGDVMLTATHGDMAKLDQMPGIVAARWAREWGETTFRYCLTGHIHHKSARASELNGMICESFQTLAAKDFWHASMGYCAGRSLTAITYHKRFGECDRITSSIPSPSRMADMRMAA